MKPRLCAGIFLFLISTFAEAKLTAEVSPQSARQNDTLTLTITDDTADNQNLPDLTPLQADFAILGTQRSFSYYTINGKTTNASQWTILLKAKKTGDLTIPSLTFNQGNTNPVSVHIENETSSSSDKDSTVTQKDIMLTTEVDDKTPWINQQIIYTIRLYNSRRLLDSQYQPPEVENALLIPLGDSRQYQKVEQGKAYMVAEQRYAIFPQKSGELTITPPVFTVLAYDVMPTEMKTQTKPLSIAVKAAPVKDSNSWLPAKEVNLTDTWDTTEKTLEQGSTLTRTIQLEANGIPAQFLQSLPALNFSNQDGYRVYPEKGVQSNVMRDGNLVGKLSMKVTYLLDKSGTITLPELKLPWFNTNTGKEETAALPPKTLRVMATEQPASASTTAASPTQTKQTQLPEMQSPPPIRTPLAWILAGLFALAWLITVGFWVFQRYTPALKKKTWKASLERLHKACIANDPIQSRQAILQWARLQWPDAACIGLGEVAALVRDIKLKQQLHILSNMLYSQGEKTWHGEALWRAVSDFLKFKPETKKQKPTLPPMNPG